MRKGIMVVALCCLTWTAAATPQVAGGGEPEWWSWLAGVWRSIVAAGAGDRDVPPAEEPPPPPPPPATPQGLDAETTCTGCTDSGPEIDPDG